MALVLLPSLAMTSPVSASGIADPAWPLRAPATRYFMSMSLMFGALPRTPPPPVVVVVVVVLLPPMMPAPRAASLEPPATLGTGAAALSATVELSRWFFQKRWFMVTTTTSRGLDRRAVGEKPHSPFRIPTGELQAKIRTYKKNIYCILD